MSRETVVLIHGLWMPGIECGLLRQRLRAQFGFATRQYFWRTLSGDLQHNVERFGAWLSRIDAERVHVVGHSLGGVLALHADSRGLLDRPGRLVCLGSPLCGSGAARSLLTWPGGRRLLGPMLREAVLERRLLRYAGARELGVIAGTLGLGLGRVFEHLEQPNDGTVAVAETRLPGITDHLELPVTHTGLLFAGSVASAAGHFLAHGRF